MLGSLCLLSRGGGERELFVVVRVEVEGRAGVGGGGGGCGGGLVGEA